MINFIFKVERWKYNKEYGVYVSTQGRVRSKTKVDIQPKVNQGGYLSVKTSNGGVMVHRLVMYTWRPTDGMNDLTVDHLNHNKRDNSLDNLEWVTMKENQRRAARDLEKRAFPKNCPEMVIIQQELLEKAEKALAKKNKVFEMDEHWDEQVYVNGLLMTYRIMLEFFWNIPDIQKHFKKKVDFQNSIRCKYQLNKNKEDRLLSKKAKSLYNCATVEPIGVKIND